MDLRDPVQAERLEYADPDGHLRRREFLQRTAMAGGLAAAAGLTLGPEALIAQAARVQRRAALPSPRELPIDTFVVLMMENRSFDHFLGWLPGADGQQSGLSYVDDDGKTYQTHPLAPDYQGCGFNDPDHSWEGGRVQLNGGRCDGFLKGDNDTYAIGFYVERDIPFLASVAKTFTTCDRFFCSILASTFPNREYMHAAQSYGAQDNSYPPQLGYTDGFPDTTIFAALSANGISNRYYFVDEPVAALWGRPGLARSSRVEEYYQRCRDGTLPAVSFVDPGFGNEEGGTSSDQHPHGDIRTGDAYMSDVVHAFIESPQWKRGALFIVWDEWGGFFDRVVPPRVPDDRMDKDLNKDYGQQGFRIPAVLVSPYARRGHVDHQNWSFESILKMIRYRFGLAPLVKRDAFARNIARAFDWQSKPQADRPKLPDPADVSSTPCGGNVAFGSSARRDNRSLRPWLDRLGFDYRPATYDSMFREPHRVRHSVRRARSG
jgi:phospholipase C